MDQEAVRAVDLDHVEPRGVGARGGVAPRARDRVDLVAALERARHRRALVGGDRARRDQLPGVPVGDRVTANERLAAFPRPPAARLASGVAELDARGRAALADEPGHARELGHERVAPQAEIADGAAAAPLDLGRFHDHQAGAAGRVAARVHQVPVVGEAVDGRVLVHRRDDDAVAQLEAADAQRAEEDRRGHWRVFRIGDRYCAGPRRSYNSPALPARRAPRIADRRR